MLGIDLGLEGDGTKEGGHEEGVERDVASGYQGS